jgi:hypothetical protein
MTNRKQIVSVGANKEVVQNTIDATINFDSQVFSTRAKPKQAENSRQNVKMSLSESASEPISGEAFGLRRVSFLLPEELAKEFDERGGGAWLALVLRGADEEQTAPIAAALPVVSKSAKSLEALPALKPDDQIHCGRRRAGMR